MTGPRGVGLRARLIALLLATLIPLVGLGGYWILSEFREERARMGHEVQETAELVAAQVGHSVAGVQERLAVLARLPAVRAGNRQEVERLFQDLLADAHHLQNLILVAPDGTIMVSAVPPPPGRPVSLGHREWLQRVVRWGEPAVGGFQVGRITGNPNVILAHPVLDEQGRLTSVVVAALDLVHASRAVTWAYPGVPLLWAIVDEQGLVLLHNRPETTSGKPLGPLPGTLRGETIVPGTTWHSVVGMPHDLVTARVRKTFFRLGLPAGLILLISAAVGLWIAYNTWRPIRDLTSAVRRVGTGESTVQIPVHAVGEVGELATTLAETLAAVDRRRGELAALLEAGRAIASSLDLEQSLQAIVQQATIISGTSVVRLLLLDADGKVLRCRVGVGLPLEEERELVIPVGESFSGQVVATGKPLAVADTRGDPRLRYPQHPTRHSLISYLGLPVKLGNRVLGVLVFNTQSPRTYSKAEIAYLSAFADQAAIAIENARLHEATLGELAERHRAEAELKQSEEHARRLAQESATMAEIGRIISSTLNIGDVYESFATEVKKLIPFDRIVISSINVEKNVVRNLYISGGNLQDRNTSNLYPLQGSGNAEMVRTKASLLIQTEDFRAYQDRFPALVSTFQAGFRSILNVPLFTKGQVIGGLLLRSLQPNAYTERDVRLAERIGSQIAGTIANAQLYLENVRLYEAAQREIAERRQAEEALAVRTRYLETIRSISQEIIRELDLKAVLDVIIRRAVELVGATSGAIRLWDQEQQLLIPKAQTGSDTHSAMVPLRLGEGVAGAAAEQRRGLIVNDFRTSGYSTPALLKGTTHTAVMATPLLYGERLVGALAITREETDPPFSEADLDVLNLFTPHAAIAIENARLHEATVRRGEQLEALLSSLKTVTSGLNLREILDRILGEAIRISGAVHVKILLLEEATQGLRVALARGGTVQPDFPAPLERSLSGTVAATGQPLFVADSQDESRNPNAAFDRQMGLRTYLGLPVKGRHGVLGVVTFNTTEPRNYSDEELSYLTSFADQAAIAIENARLYEEVRRHAEELETRVRQRTAELEEALRVKVEFLGKMSHELRTPLNFVLGFSDLLQQGTGGPLTPKQTTYLDRIQTGGKRLLSLVSDVLDIAQLDAGKSRLRLEAVILAPLVQEVLGLVQIQVSQKRLKVTTALDPWMPFIVADRFKLAQILHNLVGNAVKFTPEGGSITIRTYQEAEGRKQKADGREQEEESRSPARGGVPSAECRLPSVVIEVEDTGIGIRPENLETVFEAFYQIDGSETRAQGGVGLGLPLVRRLVELHGGRVWAESAGPGQGSRLVVRLPRLEVPKAKRILLVEDEALIRTPMAAALESAGFDVSQAAMGADALAVMEAEAFDLLILDVVLPDMEGWEILRRVREVEEVRTLPVLVVTGLKSLNAEQALARGADEFLTKPVSPRVLVDTVVRLLASSAASGAGVGPRSLRTVERPEG